MSPSCVLHKLAQHDSSSPLKDKLFRMKKILIAKISLFVLVIYSLCSCQDKYYEDGGLANPNYNGNMLQYLEQNKAFDTVAKIVKLAGLEKELTQDELTFFAPSDRSVRYAMDNVNFYLEATGKDTISIDEISPDIWRKTLMYYMYKGTNRLKDYYQLDITLKSVYPGQFYTSYNGTLVNIGVNYADVNGIKYAGYRSILFSFIPDYNSPDIWYSTPVVSHDIKPSNGVIHALSLNHTFGQLNFLDAVLASR